MLIQCQYCSWYISSIWDKCINCGLLQTYQLLQNKQIHNEQDSNQIQNLQVKKQVQTQVNQDNLKNQYQEKIQLYDIQEYIRYIFNGLIGFLIIFIIFSFIFCIKEDTNKKYQLKLQETRSQINKCLDDYDRNKCQIETRVEALNDYCMQKEICFHRDPQQVVESSLMTAQLIAEVINEFVEPLHTKSMIFGSLLLFGMILACNCNFRNKRTKQKNRNTKKRIQN